MEFSNEGQNIGPHFIFEAQDTSDTLFKTAYSRPNNGSANVRKGKNYGIIFIMVSSATLDGPHRATTIAEREEQMVC